MAKRVREKKNAGEITSLSRNTREIKDITSQDNKIYVKNDPVPKGDGFPINESE